MAFLVFLFVVWAAAMFHGWEHRQMEKSLAALAAALKRDRSAPADMKDFLFRRDWRLVTPPQGRILLRRAFNPRDGYDVFRYAAPVLLLVIMLLALKDPLTGLLYLGLLTTRWFLAAIALSVDQEPPAYQFILFGKPLFSGSLPRS